MSELLFFVLGLTIGGLTGVTIMCCLHINRINEYEKKIEALNPNEEKEKERVLQVAYK